MNWTMKLYRISLLACFVLIIGCNKGAKNQEVSSRVSILPYYNEASFTPKWLAPNSAELENFHAIPDFEFVNQEGIQVTQQTFSNTIYVADFFFTTCPGICPKMAQNMARVAEVFKGDSQVKILSHSVTPSIDSVPLLKAYATDRSIDAEQWHLVTGNKRNIYDLGRYAYFVEEDLGREKSADDFLHTENFVLIDKNKHIRGIYNGLNKRSVDQLIADIKTLQKEG